MIPRIVRYILAGYVLVEEVVAFASGMLALVALAWLLTGCGAGAIRAQARAATVAVVALEGAHRLAMEATEARLDACETIPCTEAVEADMAPVVAVHDAARVALAGWVEALQLALVAGEDEQVLGALLVAAGRWVALWGQLAAALAHVGVELPTLPAGILGAP